MTADEVNKKLLDHFGLHVIDKPKYRVVWAPDQMEKRIIKANEYVDQKEVQRDTVCEVLKYNYLGERWVLERLSFNNNPELTERITYEPIYVFQDKFGNFLPLNVEVAVIFASVAENPPKRAARNWKLDAYEEEAEFDAAKKEYRKLIDEKLDTSATADKLNLKEAVVNSWEQSKETDNV